MKRLSAHYGPRPPETETALRPLGSAQSDRAEPPSIALSLLRPRSPRADSYFRRTRLRTRRARVYRGNKIGVTVSVTRSAAWLTTRMNCSTDIQR